MKNLAKLSITQKKQAAKVKPMMSARTARAVPQARKAMKHMTGIKQGGITSAPFLRGRSGSDNIKAWRGEGGWKQAQKLKKKLTLTDKLRMQDKGIISKKTGRLHPEHERALKGLSKKELKQMIKTGRNPRLPESKSTFGTTARGRRKNLQTSRKEAKYIRDRKFKTSGGLIKGKPKIATRGW